MDEDLLQFLEECEESGYGTVLCECGEEHTLELDGYCYCDCGARVESPALREGMI
jgi:hypothetical protein